MIDYKFLEKSSCKEDNRPMLTWGMGCVLDGRNVLFAANGYRLALSWRGPEKRLIEFFPFAHSSDDYDPTEESKPVKIDGIVEGCQPNYTLWFADHDGLQKTLKSAKAFGDWCKIIVANHTAEGVVFRKAVLDVTNDRGKHATYDLDCEVDADAEHLLALDGGPVEVSLDVKMFTESLDAKFVENLPMTIGIKDGESPVRVGQWAIVASILMPMTKPR